MQDETSSRIRASIERLSEREDKKYRSRKRKNNNPEELVVKSLQYYFNTCGFFVCGYESKAKFINGVWRTSGLNVGTPDLIGVDNEGYFMAVEVKAKGKRSTLRREQREFLTKTIMCGGLGICADSVEYFQEVYEEWKKLDSVNERRILLMSKLPAPRKSMSAKNNVI
jgi:hypothetical protein